MGFGGGGGSKTQIVGYKYFMSIVMGICRGPVNEIVEARSGDRTVLGGPAETPISGTSNVYVNKPDLFGGDRKEGGIQGDLSMYFGWADQFISTRLKALIGGNVPEMRGVLTAHFDGLVAATSPYPKAWKWRVRRWNQGWDGDVWNPDMVYVEMQDNAGNIIKAMNPAHIIWECVTNREWGRGMDRLNLDEISFTKAAETLLGEGFGLCLAWSRQDSLEEFIKQVIDHIGAALYTDRSTGLLTLKLLRNDYDLETIPTFSYDSGLLSVTANENGSRENMVNEVIVTWTDPVTGEDGSVRAQNIASIQSMGAVNSSSTTYNGLPTEKLAMRVAQRDLRVQTASLIRYTVKMDRRAWSVHPGAVFKISDPLRNIQSLVLRASKVSDTTMTDGEITVDAVLDVFGLAAASYNQPEPRNWEKPTHEAKPVVNRYLTEATYRDAVMAGLDTTEYSEDSSVAAFIAMKPTQLSLSYLPRTTGRPPDGDKKTYDDQDFSPYFRLFAAIGPYDETNIKIISSGGIDGLKVGQVILIDDEMCVLEALNLTTMTVNLSRGCVDTLPKPHAANAIAYGWDTFVGSDFQEYARFQQVGVQMLTRTSAEILDEAEAPMDVINMTGRWARPYPAAGFKIGGMRAYDVTEATGVISTAWAHRNRILQQEMVLDTWEASIDPEPGTTYRLRLKKNDVTLASFDGYGTAAVQANLSGDMVLELETLRNGLPARQRWAVPLTYTSVLPAPSGFPGRRVGLVGDSITWQNTSHYSGKPPSYSHVMIGYFTLTNALLGQRLELETAMQPDPGYSKTGAGYNFGVAGSRMANWWDEFFVPLPANGRVERGPMNAALDFADQFDIVVTMGGTNDVAADLPAAQIIANIKRVCLSFSSVGKWVFLITVTPRSASQLTGYSFAKIDELQARIKTVNQAIRDWIATDHPTNIYLVDPWNDLVGPNGTDPHGTVSNTVTPAGPDTVGNWKPGVPQVPFMGDGLHPSVSGAYVIGKKLSAAMTAAGVPALGVAPTWPMGRGANLITNPTFTGTGGYKPAGTGVVPDKWMFFRSNNVGTDGGFTNFNKYSYQNFVDDYPILADYINDSTFADSAAVLSVVTLGDGRQAFRVQFDTPATGNRNESFVVRCLIPERPGPWNGYDPASALTPTPYSPGDFIEAGAEVRLSNIRGLWICKVMTEILSTNNDDPDTYVAKMQGIGMGQEFIPGLIDKQKFYPEDQVLHLKTPAVQAPTPLAGETLQYISFNLQFSVDAFSAQGSVTVDIVDPYARVVTAPPPPAPPTPGGFGLQYGQSYGG